MYFAVPVFIKGEGLHQSSIARNLFNPMATHNSAKENQVIVVMIPLPAQGHLNPLLHLSRLISAYEIPVHFVGSSTHNRQAETRIQGWNPLSNPNIIFHDFTIPVFHNPPAPNPNSPTRFPSQLIPSFRAALQLRDPISKLLIHLSNTAKRVVVIHDSLMAYTTQDASTLQNAECYTFQSCSVFTLYSFIWEMIGKPNIPEAQLFQNLPSIESSFDPDSQEFAKLSTDLKKSTSGNLYNTCRRLEGRFLELVSEALISETDKNWAIGPFNPIVISEDKGTNKRSHKSLEWLDQQSVNSVIFIAFGSTTSLTDEEINEIAVGLEKSGQKFIWVLREADKGDVFTGESTLLLPQGYEERIKDRGIIIRDWAPQLEILGHPSTGGFMSHCGWNSTIESISLGVPIAAWPMHSDQPRNAILITEVLKIGILVRDWDDRDQVVKAETIANVVTRLIDSSEGEEIRKTTLKLSEDVKQYVTEGGESHIELESFMAHISR